MTTLTHDAKATRGGGTLASGLGFALIASASFGLSGSLARGLMDAGWTPGAAVLLRVTLAALVLALPGALAMRGRWHLVRRAAPTVVVYGLFAVAGAQLFYFMAVKSLDVGIAMLLEYLAPVAVILWLWVRRGARPTRLTGIGAAIAAVGLVLLLDVLGGASVNIVGVGWALLAMVGATVYFIISGDASSPLPPISLAAGGLAVAAVVLGVAAALGLLPIAMTTADVVLVPVTLPWWGAILALGVITAALAYVAGIAATRKLGARLGSFVALSEVLAAAVFAWILLGQAPAAIQIAGAALVLAGVIVVKLGEPDATAVEPELPVIPDAPPAPVAA